MVGVCLRRCTAEFGQIGQASGHGVIWTVHSVSILRPWMDEVSMKTIPQRANGVGTDSCGDT
jgi:hypothetical protein